MASIKVAGLEELIKGNEELSKGLRGQISSMLREGAQIVTARTGDALDSMTAAYTTKRKQRRTGALKASVRAGNAKVEADESSIQVWPHGKRTDGNHKKGARNETIGFVLEYGRGNMAPRPFMAEGEDKSQEEVQRVWGRMFEEYVATGGK